MKLHLTKLDSRGITHMVFPLVIIVGVGLIGTYMLVASHAQVPPDQLSWHTISTKSVSASPYGNGWPGGSAPGSIGPYFTGIVAGNTYRMCVVAHGNTANVGAKLSMRNAPTSTAYGSVSVTIEKSGGTYCTGSAKPGSFNNIYANFYGDLTTSQTILQRYY